MNLKFRIFWTLFFAIFISSPGFSQFWTYDCPGCEEYKSPDYKVSIIQGGDTLQTFVYYSYGLGEYTRYTWQMDTAEVRQIDHKGPKSHSAGIFSFSGKVLVRVEVLEGASHISLPLTSAKILPSSYNIPCEIKDGNIIEFELDRPEKVAVMPNYDEAWDIYAQKGIGHIPIQNWTDNYSVERQRPTYNGVNLPDYLTEGYQNPLFIFAHAPEKRVPDSTSTNVLRLYPGDDITQNKLNQYETVWFTPGIHDLSDIGEWPWFQTEINRGQTFYLEGGSYVKAQFIESERGTGPSSVTGRGVLSGIGHPYIRNGEGNSVCVDIDSIIGITITDRASFGIRRAHYIGDIAMIGAWHGNTDGPDFSDDCLIENSFFQAHDDNIKINHNTHVRHCVIWQGTNAHPIMVKEILRDGMVFENSLVEDVDIITYLPGTDWNNPWPQISRAALSVVTAMDLEIVNLTFRDIRIESPYVPRVLNVYSLNTNIVNPGWFNDTSDDYHTRINGITFENITVNSPVIGYRSLIGEGYKNSTKNIALSNIIINGTLVTEENLAEFFEIECENITELTINGSLVDTSCDTPGDTIPEIISVYGITIGNCPSSLLYTGDTHELIANVAPENATNKGVTWSSSNTQVATVDSTGLVTAISQGSVTITATTHDGGFTRTCAIGIRSTGVSVTGVTLSGCPAGTLEIDSTYQLTAHVAPSDAGDLRVSWSSSDETVATVDEDGLITVLSEGETTITATTSDGGYTDECEIVVGLASSMNEIPNTPNGIKVYPNPAQDKLFFEFPKDDSEKIIRIYNLYGQLLTVKNTSESNFKMDIRNFNVGNMIFIHITVNGITSIKKFVVN